MNLMLFRCLTMSVILLMHTSLVLSQNQSPPDAGLVLWLDASDASSLTTDDDHRVTQWRDKSKAQSHLSASALGPKVLDEQLRMLRFFADGKATPLTTSKIREGTGPVTLFVVARRTEEQASDKKWQRLASASQQGKQDNKDAGFFMCLSGQGGAEAFDAAIFSSMKRKVAAAPITIGASNHDKSGGALRADVAEILIYDHAFENPADFEAVQDYLANKWNVNVARDVGGWTHEGPLPAAIVLKDPALPLFDQTSTGNWQPLAKLTDEFEGDSLDEEKWWDHNPAWHGRVPARFLPENVEVKNGELLLTVRKDATLPSVKLYDNQDRPYEHYSAASVVSKSTNTYGCFEVRVKVANTSCTSSFWFAGQAKKEKPADEVDDPKEKFIVRSNELDVFELPAGCSGHEHRFGMNMHVSKEPETDHHWSNWGNWEAPFRWIDDYHTISFVWSPDWIRYYIDGHCIRTTRNVAWHTPERMIFDMEAMSWLPFPKDSEFPATFHIDYVRAWTNPDWPVSDEWFPAPDPAQPTKITELVRELTKVRREKNLIAK